MKGEVSVRIDARLLLPAVAVWAVAGILVGFPDASSAVAIAGWGSSLVLVAVAIVAVRARTTVATVAVICAAAALAATSVALHEPGRRPVALDDLHRVDGATVVVTQTVTRSSRFFDATLVSLDGSHGANGALDVPIVVFDGAPRQRVELGTTLRLSGQLKTTPPGEDASALLFANAPGAVAAPPPGYLAWADSLRSGLAFAATALPGDGGALLPGLALGDTVSVSPSLSDAMKASSLTHLTAVSGANCAVLIALAMLGGRAVGLSRGLRVAGSVVVLAGFVVLVTPQPSVLRAAVMAAIVLVALARGRPSAGVPVLAAASLVLLIEDPWMSRNYGFALSVLATLGLLVLAPPLTRLFRRWVPGWLALLVAVPAAAQVACQPVLFLLAPTIPLYGVIANLLAEPAAPLATVLGLIGCLALPVAPVVGRLLIDLAWLPASWIAGVARFFAGLPGARLPWPNGVVGLLAIVAVTALVVGLLVTRSSRRVRRGLAMAIVAVVVLVISASGTAALVGSLSRPRDWAIADCDIGQGDAMIVRSANRIALMDTGPSEPLLRRCLHELGISRIDLLVLSHYDLDHVAGTPAVDGMVTRALVGPSSGQRRDAQILAGLLRGGAQVDRVTRGVSGRLGDLRWSVLWPLHELGDIQPGNEACVTVLFEPVHGCRSGCLRSLFVGDLDEHAQDRMLQTNPGLAPVDVVEVAHHGSADQSAAFYRTVRAPIGLIGVGLRNRYGHPTAHLFDILAGVGTTPERTDRQGLILVEPGSSPGRIAVWSERPDAPSGRTANRQGSAGGDG